MPNLEIKLYHRYVHIGKKQVYICIYKHVYIHTHTHTHTHVSCVLPLHSCPTLCDPMDYSLPGFYLHRILQARTLEWVARPSSITTLTICGFRHPLGAFLGRVPCGWGNNCISVYLDLLFYTHNVRKKSIRSILHKNITMHVITRHRA